MIFYPVFVAAAADLDFIPQLITGESYHRGLSHSLIFALGFSGLVSWILSYFWKSSYKQLFIFTTILYSSHLFLDFFSEGRGIKLLLPWTDAFFVAPITIFPGVHYSRGLWDVSYLIPLCFELVYAALLFLIVAMWKRAKTNKKRSDSDQASG